MHGRSPRSTVTALVVAVALALAACGGSASQQEPRLVVSAASSLKEALTSCSPRFAGAKVRISFAGSDELAAQIRRGVRSDVFAAANLKLPRALASEGLVTAPVAFAANELVLAVPASRAMVASLADLSRPGVRIAVGSPSTPVGAYTREVIARLPAVQGRRILANVRTEEPDVKGVVAKLTQGAVDAGFVYRSDVVATAGRLRAIAPPPRVAPEVAYGAAVVRRSARPALARRYAAGLRTGACARALRAAGFKPPPP